MKVTRRSFIELTSAASAAGITITYMSKWLPSVAAAGNPAVAIPPPAEHPRFRWWWPGGAIVPDEVEREVNELADAGFGGFEIADVRDGLGVPLDPKVYGWGSDHWNAGVLRAFETAHKRGLKADITLGPHWPVGVPGVTPDDDAAAKELVHGAAVVAGGERFSGALPQSKTIPHGVEQLGDIKVTITPKLLAVQAYREGEGSTKKTVMLDPASRIDLTQNVRNGRLEWTAPAGDSWHLLTFWVRGTAQIQNMFGRGRGRNTSMLSDPIAFAIDVYGKAGVSACTHYWDEHLIGPRLKELMREMGSDFFEDSLELSAEKHWSVNFPAEFKQRRGYDVIPYLPLLAVAPEAGGMRMPWMRSTPTAPYAFAGVDSERFSRDFEQTLVDMYVYNHCVGMQSWAQSLGMGFRVQCLDAGAPYVAIPEGDNGDDYNGWTALAAGRDLVGHKILSDEAGTFIGGQAYVATWKLLAFMLQRDFIGGVNQAVIHGKSYAKAPGARWPGYSAFGFGIGNDWGPRNPDWLLASDFSAYVSRFQHLLRQGRSQVDLAILSPVRTNLDPLQFTGFTHHIFTLDYLHHPNATVRAKRFVPDGPAYKAIVVNKLETLAPGQARKLVEFARAGLPVVVIGDMPAHTPGLYEIEKQETELRAAMTELSTLKDFLRVKDVESVAEALKGAGIMPQCSFSQPARLFSQRRLAGRTEYYYLLNDSDAQIEGKIAIRTAGTPFVIDMWSGAVEPVAVYAAKSGTLEIPVKFGPSEARIYAITSDETLFGNAPRVHAVAGDGDLRVTDGRLAVFATSPGTYTAHLSDGRTVQAKVKKVEEGQELSAWSLEVEDWQPGSTPSTTNKVRHDLKLDKLAAWTQLPNLRGASGVGRYKTTVTLDSSWDSRDGAVLQLGRVGGIFRVLVNGRQLPPANQFTTDVDVSSWLKPGRNQIEVIVATNLNNRFLADNIEPRFAMGRAPNNAPNAKAPEDLTPSRKPDPLLPPTGEMYGAPRQETGNGRGGPVMQPGASLPGGSRHQQDYGLIGPVRLVPYTKALLSGN